MSTARTIKRINKRFASKKYRTSTKEKILKKVGLTLDLFKNFTENEFCDQINEGGISVSTEYMVLRVEWEYLHLIGNHEFNRENLEKNYIKNLGQSMIDDGQINPSLCVYDKETGRLLCVNGISRKAAAEKAGIGLDILITTKDFNLHQLAVANTQRAQKAEESIEKLSKLNVEPYRTAHVLGIRFKEYDLTSKDLYAAITGKIDIANSAKKLEKKFIDGNLDEIHVTQISKLDPFLKFIRNIIKSSKNIKVRTDGLRKALFPIFALGDDYRKKNNIKIKWNTLEKVISSDEKKRECQDVVIDVRKIKSVKVGFITEKWELKKFWDSSTRSREFYMEALNYLYKEYVEDVDLCSPEMYDFILTDGKNLKLKK